MFAATSVILKNSYVIVHSLILFFIHIYVLLTLALRAKNGTYYLNGDYHIDFPRSMTIAGALWYYERSQQGFAAPDKLRCLGPTNEPLYLSVSIT